MIRPAGRVEPLGRGAGVEQVDLDTVVGGALGQLLGVHHLGGVAHGVHQPERCPAPGEAPLPDHRHQRDHPRAATHEQDRLLDRRLGARRPDEPAADRTTELELVAELHALHEVRRHLAVADLLDGDRHPLAVLGSRDRVGPLGGVAVRGGEAYVDVLTRLVARPSRHLEGERARRACLGTQPDEPGREPRRTRTTDQATGAGGEDLSHRRSAPRARGRRSCGSRSPPRTRARPRSSG